MEKAAGGGEPRRSGSDPDPDRAPEPGRSPSPSRLDVSSARFDPLLALYSARTPLPFPGAPCFNNLAEYESFQRGLRRPPARRGPPASRSARRRQPAADPERLQRLRSLMVNRHPEREAAARGRAGPRRAPRNVLTRMPLHEGSPLGELHRCVRDGVKVNVHIRTFKGLRGVCTGFLVAFDKFWNMALTDVDETYRKPVLGKAFYNEPQLTLTRLFDRLKLQESLIKKGADSRTATEEPALTNESKTLGRKAGSGWGRAEDECGMQKFLGGAGEKTTNDNLHLAVRNKADLPSRAAQTEGTSAGGANAKGQPRKKRRPKVDYQQTQATSAFWAGKSQANYEKIGKEGNWSSSHMDSVQFNAQTSVADAAFVGQRKPIGKRKIRFCFQDLCDDTRIKTFQAFFAVRGRGAEPQC